LTTVIRDIEIDRTAETLFIEIVTTTVNEVSDPVAVEVLQLQRSDNVEDDLRRLAVAFESLAARGALAVHDPRAAAGHFNWLVMSAPLNGAMLLGTVERPADLGALAADGVAAFLAAYGPR
jgi:hypothetical protein